MDTLGFSLDTESSTCFCEPTLSVQQQQPYQLQSLNSNQKLCFLKFSKNPHFAHSLQNTIRPSSNFTTQISPTTSDANGNDLSLQLNTDRCSTHISISYIEKSKNNFCTIKSTLPCHSHYRNHQPLSIEQFKNKQKFDSNHRNCPTPLIERKISISLSTIPQSCCSSQMNSSPRSLSNERIDRNVSEKNNNKLLISQDQAASSKRKRRATSQLAVHSNKTTTSASETNYNDNKNTNRKSDDQSAPRTATRTRQDIKQSLKQNGAKNQTKNSKEQTNYQVDIFDSNTSNTDSSSATDADNYNEPSHLILPMYKVPKNEDDNNSNKDNDNRLLSGHKISLPLIISPVSKQQNYFYANQVNINHQNSSSIESFYQMSSPRKKKKIGSHQKLTHLASPRRNPPPNLPEYFTAFAMKPSYEQIADCITADNIQQLYKWVIDGFGNQVYSWRNAFVLADSSARMKDFMTQIPKYQVRAKY